MNDFGYPDTKRHSRYLSETTHCTSNVGPSLSTDIVNQTQHGELMSLQEQVLIAVSRR